MRGKLDSVAELEMLIETPASSEAAALPGEPASGFTRAKREMRSIEDKRKITEMVVRFMPGSPALLFIIQGTEEIVNKTNL
jgi:hypothetical protein